MEAAGGTPLRTKTTIKATPTRSQVTPRAGGSDTTSVTRFGIKRFKTFLGLKVPGTTRRFTGKTITQTQTRPLGNSGTFLETGTATTTTTEKVTASH